MQSADESFKVEFFLLLQNIKYFGTYDTSDKPFGVLFAMTFG